MYMCHNLQVFKIGLVIIFSLVSIPHARASLRCPHKCKCSATSITCVEQQLVEVPDFRRITFKPGTIDLSKNEIEEITNLSFNYKNLETLVNLQLQENSIFDVQLKALCTLTKLHILDLSFNLIEDFPGDTIVCNKELKELKLAGNLFGTKTPELKSDSLEVLDLSFGKLSQFSKENVEGLPNLRFLYLQANNLIELDYKILGMHLQFIDLSFNAWKCQCDTVKLFQHLVKNNQTVVSNPVQCVQSFRRYEDIYDSNGPVNISKQCPTKLNPSIPSISIPVFSDTPSIPEEVCIDNKIWIGLAVAVGLLLVAGVALIFILKRQERYKKNTRSKNTIYSELPSRKTIILQKNASKNVAMYGEHLETV